MEWGGGEGVALGVEEWVKGGAVEGCRDGSGDCRNIFSVTRGSSR